MSSKDTYYRRAKEANYRARSAYKLIQLHEQYRIFDDVHTVIDLCAAPGSWSQVLTQYISNSDQHKRRIVAVDLQPIAPISGVEIVQGDITDKNVCLHLLSLCDRACVDLIVCDGAPDISGIHILDEYVHSQLMLAAFNVVCHALKHGGTYVAKLFAADNIQLILNQYRRMFTTVHLCKPPASRTRSAEHFIVCIGYAPPTDWVPDWYSHQDIIRQLQDHTHLSPQTYQRLQYFFTGSLGDTPAADHTDRAPHADDTHPYLRLLPSGFGV